MSEQCGGVARHSDYVHAEHLLGLADDWLHLCGVLGRDAVR